jgi:ATP-dependent Lhr-like helicase
MNPLESFHPAVAAWFSRAFDRPTSAQAEAWPAIQAGRHTLIAAPTGSGKTFAAFLAAIDDLVRQGVAGRLADETQVVYVSPLKALSNDINRNLEAPLAGISEELHLLGLPEVAIRTFVRTGDTPQTERAAARRNPPHIVVTTPESLYILLGSQSGREMLSTTRTVIVDEIHAVAGNKRGAHLALSLERLEALVAKPLVRVGLSATQKPIEEVARFLVGVRGDHGNGECTIVDSGHVRSRDLAIEVPAAPLEAVMSGDVWTQVYDRLAELSRAHRTTLVFVNTRRAAERTARHLSERLGDENVAAHHGSMAKELRFDAEHRLKRGELKLLVATASLELGIDIGDVDLVCQLGSTRSINSFLQRAGRAGHSVGGVSKGRLFPLSRDELVECTALLEAIRRGELDRLEIPENQIDVVTQQIAAEAGGREWNLDELFALFRRAYPFRNFDRREFDELVRMLGEGYSTRRGRHGALVHHDAVNGVVRGRKGTRLTSITNGGTIPDTADYKVVLEPEGHMVGTLNEDFAIESLAGDVFQLGNASYRILRVEQGAVRVEDAQGQPPTIPFWLGEAPGRSDELSIAVSRLRRQVEVLLDKGGRDGVLAWLMDEIGLSEAAAIQLVDYLAAGRAALGCLPTQDTLVFERFFDEAGGMQLVIHTPFGSRVNRAWGLALRKRFCRKFNFELQAAATEDNLILSLTTAHSFELPDVAKYLHTNTARQILVQALCAAPMFELRWRWDATIALALPRFRGGKKVPPQIARMNAEDLLASVFPDQVACAENLPGELEIPDHPLVRQTIRDCLEDAMDVEGFENLLRGLESGDIRVVACDLTEPSPLALEVLSARPYAFLDDAPLEERRTQAVMSRRWMDPESAADIGKLDADAVNRVREEAWPDASSGDELHDALLWLTYLTDEEVHASSTWPRLLRDLAAEARVTHTDSGLWLAAERRPMFEAVLRDASFDPDAPAPATYAKTWDAGEAMVEIVRGRLEGLGPVTVSAIAASLNVPNDRVDAAMLALQAEGFAMKGRFTPGAQLDEWCERRLLARIHRYTVKRLRAEIEPVQARDFLRFLFDWQRVLPEARMQGPDAVAAVLAQLEGFEAPAAAWETEILPSRIAEYEPAWLDEHCLAGRFVWTRLATRKADPERGAAPVRSTPVTLLARRNVKLWSSFAETPDLAQLTERAREVAEFIQAHGASFFDEIAEGLRLLPTQAEQALAELVALGFVNSDSFGGLRALLVPADRRSSSRGRGRGRRIALFGMADAGRWALVRRPALLSAGSAPKDIHDPAAIRRADDEAVEHVVRTLLRRWGVIFWRLMVSEAAWLPPWRDVLMCCRRLEARGEIRGGRFVTGFPGEQFASPDAIGLLRDVRRKEYTGQQVAVSAADPLNLVGILTPGARLPALTGNRVLYRDGVPIAVLAGGETRFLEKLEPKEQWDAQNAVLRRHVPAVLASLA